MHQMLNVHHHMSTSTHLLYSAMITDRLQREVMGVTDGVSVNYVVSPMAVREELETTHCAKYIDRFLTGLIHLLLSPRRQDAFFHAAFTLHRCCILHMLVTVLHKSPDRCLISRCLNSPRQLDCEREQEDWLSLEP